MLALSILPKWQGVSIKPSMEANYPRKGAEGINYPSAFSFSFPQVTSGGGSSYTPPSKTTKHTPEPRIETVDTHSLAGIHPKGRN